MKIYKNDGCTHISGDTEEIINYLLKFIKRRLNVSTKVVINNNEANINFNKAIESIHKFKG